MRWSWKRLLRSWQARTGRPPVVEAGPNDLDETVSLRALIEEQKRLHIVYVHGIKAEGPGASKSLISFLKTQLGLDEPAAYHDTPLHLGPSPAAATYFDAPIFQGNDWNEAQPFVRHHRLLGQGGTDVLIDEY